MQCMYKCIIVVFHSSEIRNLKMLQRNASKFCHFLEYKIPKLWQIDRIYFIKHKPLISEECDDFTYYNALTKSCWFIFIPQG